ncbi:hypothetical protein OH76DRAFT_216384 [Lentinus brumalis]|uniref:Uncharacterized protein n=1 Tax=Lentinus brumalis TaxID=2498619 RepID=A0A371CKF7_9APHY|nr:hypothetical protein OH76DRAFT_1365697 [Polyporus brumalis]RDX41481.1 hypothetical protein OH76DRAFT_216384 [Polyporus brumalis]
MRRVLFPLNDTIVVALPRLEEDNGQPCRVVQVTLKAEDRSGSVDTITTYYLVRHDLSDLMLRLVVAHQQCPESFPDILLFDDSRYSIRAECAYWPFGQRVRFQWGDEDLEACEHKWTFWFRAKPFRATSQSEDGSV